MSCIYLVTFNNSKKVLHCEKCELYNKLIQYKKFIQYKKNFLLYQWNNEFEGGLMWMIQKIFQIKQNYSSSLKVID